MIKMRVTGVKELQAKFERIKLDMADTYAAALVAGAYPVINATKDGAPYLSGTLRRSYHIGTKSQDITKPQVVDGAPQLVSKSGVAVVADGLRRGRTVEVLVGTDVDYAPPQEFLHKPHLRPALEGNRAEVRAEVQRAVRMMIKKATT